MTRHAQPHTVIFGLGVTGYSCLRFLAGRESVVVLDTRRQPPYLETARRAFPEVAFHCGALDAALLEAAQRIVVSPGVSLAHPLLEAARARGVPLTSDVALFCGEVRAPVIAVTGTNGKSTVTALTGELLSAAGIEAAVGGNLGAPQGKPALDLLRREAQIYVLELSSFQLERLGTERFDIAAVLNVSPDHMDRYERLDDYAAVKRRIYRGASAAVHNRADALTTPPSEVPRRVSVGLDFPPEGSWGVRERRGRRELCLGEHALLGMDELALQGRHNEVNAMAAAALATVAGAAPERFIEALRGFRGLAHRCELIASHAGVRYVNDSKATNVGATVAALEGLGDAGERHILLIAGGDAKQADLGALRDPVARYVAQLFLLGKDADRLAAALEGLAPARRVASLEEAVCRAAHRARPGDIVLLSPACASLDMFADFEARGRAFADAVHALIAGMGR